MSREEQFVPSKEGHGSRVFDLSPKDSLRRVGVEGTVGQFLFLADIPQDDRCLVNRTILRDVVETFLHTILIRLELESKGRGTEGED